MYHLDIPKPTVSVRHCDFCQYHINNFEIFSDHVKYSLFVFNNGKHLNILCLGKRLNLKFYLLLSTEIQRNNLSVTKQSQSQLSI